MFCLPLTHTLTSLSFLPPISSAPIPSLLTDLFRFPILKGMSRMSLTLHMLMIKISFCLSKDAHAHSLLRLSLCVDNACFHTPSFSALSGHCHSRSGHETAQFTHSLSFGFLISSISTFAYDFSRMEEILPLPTGYSLLKLVDELDLSVHQCIHLIPSLLQNWNHHIH